MSAPARGMSYGAATPLVLAAAGAWLSAGLRPWLLVFAVLWGGATLCFVAGSRWDGGTARVAAALWLFLLGVGALAAYVLLQTTVGALAALAVGFAGAAVVDRAEAGRGIAMAIATAGLLALIVLAR